MCLHITTLYITLYLIVLLIHSSLDILFVQHLSTPISYISYTQIYRLELNNEALF